MRVVRYFIYTRAEFAAILRLAHIPFESCDEFVDALHFQRGTEETREQGTFGNQFANGFVRNRPFFQIRFHGGFALHGDVFHDIGKRLGSVVRSGKIYASVRETFLQLLQKFRFIGCGSVHFVDEDECGHVIALQQSP